MEKITKVLVTGSSGFVGKNLIAELRNKGGYTIYPCDIDTTAAELDEYCQNAQFVFHLAGVNRPLDAKEFMLGNYGFTTTLVEKLVAHGNKAPILMSSSIQAKLDNDYGKSKKAGEDYLLDYGENNGVLVDVFRLPNVFGKWCRPNYNSAVATFCHNIAHDLPIQVNNPDTSLNLVYIDDVVEAFLDCLADKKYLIDGYCSIPTTYTATLGQITALLYSFNASRADLSVCDFSDGFTKKLYSTYLSYLPSDGFSYPLHMNVDNRGSFTEVLRTFDRGQVSVNISKPHIIKGNHWHHTKNEKFLVVSGHGIIRFRNISDPSNNIIEYQVSGDKLEVVDIPCGYTHNIENIGDDDMVTLMWVNEPFDQARPDTYFEKV